MKNAVPIVPSLLLLLSALALASCGVPDSALVESWRIAHGDSPERSDPSFDDSSWESLTAPALIPVPEADSWFWLRADVRFEGPGPFWLISQKFGAACQVFVDGVLVGERGSLPPRPLIRPGVTDAWLVPSNLVEDGRAVVAVRSYARGTSADYPGFKVGGREAAEFELHTARLLNLQVYIVLAVLCLFLGAYFIWQYKSRPKDRFNLWYALSLVLISFYFYELGAERFIPVTLAFKAFAKVALTASIGFLMLFFTEFFDILSGRVFKVLVGVQILAFSALFFVNTGDETELMDIFSLSLLPIFAEIISGVYILVRAALLKRSDAIPILAGLVLGVGFGVHDIVYQVGGTEPMAWLQGFTFFALDMGVFVAMSARAARAANEVEVFARETAERRDRLGAVVDAAGRVVGAVAAMARDLEERAGELARTAELSRNEAKAIEAEADRQRVAVGEAVGSANDMARSSERVDEELALESERLEGALGAVGDIISGTVGVSSDVTVAAELSEGLARRVEDGVRDVASLGSSIAKVREASKEITEVVESVNDFAERTNLLAMNASIEAAHAGAAGRGFSVIAHEIKKLAQASADRAARIGEMASSIDALVSEGAGAAAKVENGLGRIAADSGDAVGRIKGVAEAALRQRELADGASSVLGTFSDSSRRMREQTAAQAGYSRLVRDSMGALEEGAARVKSAGSRIVTGVGALAEQAIGLRDLATRSSAIAAELASIVGKRTDSEEGIDLLEPEGDRA